MDLLIQRFNPRVLCLKETCVKAVNTSFFRKYSFYYIIGSVTENKASGGVIFMVNTSVPHSDVRLNTKLQAVAIRASPPKTITIFTIYLPPSLHWETKRLEVLIAQLPPPFILMGFFNAHRSLWGCDLTDKKKKHMEDLRIINNLSLFNTKSITSIHPGTGKQTTLDLTITNPTLLLDWT